MEINILVKKNKIFLTFIISWQIQDYKIQLFNKP